MLGAPALGVVRIGRIAHYDSPRGTGVLEDTDGIERFFHCTAIADGTREIADGTTVFYELRPGLLGELEATRITSARMLEAAAD
jgi:cold shock CspA family protein